jgi:hypothetical protein
MGKQREREIERVTRAMFRESLWRNKVAIIFVCACFAGAFFICLVLPGDLFLLPWQRVDVNGPPTTKRELGTVISVKLIPGAKEPVRLAEISYGGFTAEVMAPPNVRAGDTVEVIHSIEHPALIARVRLVGRAPFN